MFLLLLTSIHLFGNLDNNVKILVYTTSAYKDLIMKSTLSENLLFEICDTYDTIDAACKSRLDLFTLQSVHDFETILYLDTDIIVASDLRPVFELCQKDILYVLEEGSLDEKKIYWGKQLFTRQEMLAIVDKSAFTSGILLFRNCKRMHGLFCAIKSDIGLRSHLDIFCDQPFIVYNAFKYRCFDNKIFKKYAVNNETNNHMCIHHFPGGPGDRTNTKLTKMKNFLLTIYGNQ